jgi:hypothetical protein
VRIHVGNIVQQMSPEVRRQAEEEATSLGVTLEKFVEDQLSVQLSEQELAVGANAIRFDRWDVRGDSRPTDGGTRVGISIGGRFPVTLKE